ncbi:MAG: hypothetical protein BMS9Abin18_1173 [Zetaproteobacteria bacterium]|nr:MAG: hypothetical protein BMS9Abin18_1173 [Zetaproteobacteria bacterium]
MAEFENGKAPEKVQGLEDQSTPEAATPVQDQSQENMETPAEEAAVRSSSHGKLWLVLLLIVAALPLGWFLLPESTRQQWADALMNRISPAEVSDTNIAPAPAPPQATAPVSVTPTEAPPEPMEAPVPHVATPQPSPPTSNTPTMPSAASSEEVEALITAMEKLQSNMQALQDKQVELRQELHVRQQLELRTRLRWIANPQSQLAQMASFWQDIALLPMLNESERNEAETMRKLAADDADKLDAWTARLKRLAATLPVPEHQDIIPKPKNPAFSWLIEKFHLRPAPTPEQQALAELRTRLVNTAHALTVQIWPEHKTWRHLLADLREQFGDDADLALPERLDNIRKDIAAMRAKAASWLEEL